MFALNRHRLFKMVASLWLSFVLLFASGVAPALALVDSTSLPTNIDEIIADVPTGDRFIKLLYISFLAIAIASLSFSTLARVRSLFLVPIFT